MTLPPDWGSVLRRVFIAEFSPRTLIQNFDAKEHFLCSLWILISFHCGGNIEFWFDLPLPQVSDLLSIMGPVYNRRGPFWQFPQPGIFKKWVKSTLCTHRTHHCQLEVKKCNEMLCGFSQLSAVRGLLGTAGGERAECSLSRNQFSNISLVTFEKPLLPTQIGALALHSTQNWQFLHWREFVQTLVKIDNVQLCETQIERCSRLACWMIILRQEWQTGTSYLISLSPLLFENIACFLFNLIVLRNSASSLHWLSSSIFHLHLFVIVVVVRSASVTSPLMPTIWCFRPYKPYIFCEDMILATCQCDHILIWWSSYHPTSNMKQKRPITCYIFENEGTQGYQIWYSGVSFLSYDDYHIIIWCLSYHHMMIIMLSYKDHQQTENMLYFHQRLY